MNLVPAGIYLFKVNNKNTRKCLGISTKLTKRPPKEGHLQGVPNSDIISLSFEESRFSGGDADSDGEF